MQCKVIGIDLAKLSMQVCLLGADNKVLSNKKLSRKSLLNGVRKIDPQVPVTMESCAISHYWGRRFTAMGRKVVLLPAQHVKPLVGHQKNYDCDLYFSDADERSFKVVVLKSFHVGQ